MDGFCYVVLGYVIVVLEEYISVIEMDYKWSNVPALSIYLVIKTELRPVLKKWMVCVYVPSV